MASVPPATHEPLFNADPVCRRVTADERADALSLLLGGQGGAWDAAVERFVDHARTHDLSLDELWAAFRGGTAVAATLIVPNAGSAGMLFISPVASRAQGEAATRVVDAACNATDPSSIRLLQALLDPHQLLEAEALGAAGFERLATLVYMQRAAAPQRSPLERFPRLSPVQWRDDARPLFERAILGSYVDTLDCPRLVGTRSIDQILAGHRGTGRFHSSRWLVMADGDAPAAVMLLAEIPDRRALELVYLGVMPAWRGRGLGDALVRHALDRAHADDLTRLILAVDQDNTPALKLYRRLRFLPQARKLAMIRVLPR